MSYLLAIAIGPVQDFIAAARRSRDLWFGSYLLSELSKSVALALHSKGRTLIFPPSPASGELNPGSDYNVSNKILAIVTDPPTDELLKALRAAALAALQGYFDSAKNQIRNRIQLNESICKEQLNSVLEFYAVWVPYSESEHNQCRINSELLLAARKATRDFPSHTGYAGLPKSSLDGFRENVLLHDTRMKNAALHDLRDNEMLDAIAVVKRFAQPKRGKAPAFDSTIDVAGQPYIQPMIGQPEFENYKTFLQRNKYPETIGHLYAHESRQLLDEDDDPILKAELKQILDAIRHRWKEDPNPPYYAVLVGDGDFMGRAIENIESPEAHQDFSRQLSRFAGDAKQALDRLQACPIYTGGDDVLALIPLHTLLEVIQELRRLFRQSMVAYPNVTLSCGVAIAHALDPLSDTLDEARRAERKAKSIPGKDALAITMIPRSGSPLALADKADALLQLLYQLQVEVNQDRFGFSLAYDLRSFLNRYPLSVSSVLPQLLARHLAKKEGGELIHQFLVAQQPPGTNLREWLDHFCNALLVLRPLHRARQEATR